MNFNLRDRLSNIRQKYLAKEVLLINTVLFLTLAQILYELGLLP